MMEGETMLANKHDCYAILFKLQEQGEDITTELKELLETDTIPKRVVNELVNQDNDVVNFYLNLNKKAHKIIKEILTCEGKPVGTYLKIATSIITQGVIAMEHLYKDDIDGQTNFIECLRLKEISTALSTYFNNGDYSELVEVINLNKADVKLLLD